MTSKANVSGKKKEKKQHLKERWHKQNENSELIKVGKSIATVPGTRAQEKRQTRK